MPAGAVPVIVGSAFAFRYGVLHAPSAVAAAVGAILIQIGTNLANDYYDHVRGADNERRVGPARASASGLLSPKDVLAAAVSSFCLAAAVGLYLVSRGGWPIVVIGLVSLLCGYAYTGGPFPLAYHGLGDLFVFGFFGVVAVVGSYYVQAQAWPGHGVFIAGVAIGMISTAILVANNLRDLETDRAARKRTLAVMIGARATQVEYALLVIVPYALVAIPVLQRRVDPVFALPLLSLPLALYLAHQVWHHPTAANLNRVLGQTGLLLTVFGLLWAAGAAA